MTLPTGRRELPSKEAALFRNLLKHYEHKQYKKGLKMADQILKKVGDHGETMAMKGLFLNHMERKEEGYDWVKRGIKCDLTSHICWHVFGLLYRSDKNYEEAIKCYRRALKYDENNLQILRDFALLQLQIRNLQGFHDARVEIFRTRQAHKPHWIGLIVSHHLLGNFEEAVKVCDAYWENVAPLELAMRATNNNGGNNVPIDYENSEFLLYRLQLLLEGQMYGKALDGAISGEALICDKTQLLRIKAQALDALDRREESKPVWAELVRRNPDDRGAIEGWLGLSANTANAAAKLAHLMGMYPESGLLPQLVLQRTRDETEQFNELLETFVREKLERGVPSVFVQLKPLMLQSSWKAKAVRSVVEQLYAEFKLSNLNLRSDKKDEQKESTETCENPENSSQNTTLPTFVWAAVLMAQVHDFDGERDAALSLLARDKICEVAAKDGIIEPLIFRAKIEKHAGQILAAASSLEEARKLDLKDRFVNTKAAKYALRCNNTARAEELVTMFTKQAATHEERLYDLVDMQSMWYAYEAGMASLRKAQQQLKKVDESQSIPQKEGKDDVSHAVHLAKALKKFHQIEKIFCDWWDDQFDFHTYCLRKMTLVSYIEMIRLEDSLRGSPYFVRAAHAAIEIYLQLHANFDNLPVRPQKMIKKSNGVASAEQKLKKEAKIEEDDENTNNNKEKTAAPVMPKDEDPEGFNHVFVEDRELYWQKIDCFLKPLLDLGGSSIDAQLAGVRVFCARQMKDKATECLQKASVIVQKSGSLADKAKLALMQALHRHKFGEDDLETTETREAVMIDEILARSSTLDDAASDERANLFLILAEAAALASSDSRRSVAILDKISLDKTSFKTMEAIKKAYDRTCNNAALASFTKKAASIFPTADIFSFSD